MFRPTVLCFLGCVLGFCAGCERASEPVGRAAVAKAGLMPGPEAGFESIYVANQSEVKLVPAREVSYEPLESFVKEDAPRRSRAVPRASKSHSAEKPKSFVGKTRQLLSGLLGRKKAGSRPHPDGLSAKSDSDESDDADIDEDSGEDESASADEDFDEDESASADEDEDSDEDESASADEDEDSDEDESASADEDEDSDEDESASADEDEDSDEDESASADEDDDDDE